MTRKHDGPPPSSSRPHDNRRSHRDARIAFIRKVAADFERGTIGEDDFARYTHRLDRMVREWPEFAHIRFDSFVLQRVLRSLPERDLMAMLNPQLGQRRSRKVRAQLLNEAFDDELLDLAVAAIERAAERAGSPDDQGALGVAFSSLQRHADGSMPPETNPMLFILLVVSLEEFINLVAALRKVETKEKEEGTGAVADDAESLRQRQEALAENPAIRLFIDHQTFRLSHRLFDYLHLGVIKTRLTEEQLGPLVAEVEHLTQRTPAGAASAGEAGAAREQPLPRHDFLELARAFAAEPANDRVFRGFVEALAAEAQEAAHNAHPLAERIEALAQFCRRNDEPNSPVRVIICRGSLARIVRERAALQQGREDQQAQAPA